MQSIVCLPWRQPSLAVPSPSYTEMLQSRSWRLEGQCWLFVMYLAFAIPRRLVLASQLCHLSTQLFNHKPHQPVTSPHRWECLAHRNLNVPSSDLCAFFHHHRHPHNIVSDANAVNLLS